MRILADTNIVSDVIYAGERPLDPGDEALLAESVSEGRVFLTKDHDIGALVHRDSRPHKGVLLVDDLGAPAAESALVLAVRSEHGGSLSKGAFLRAGAGGVRVSQH